jgi:serine/threonine protein kinase, bacterial
MESLSTQGSKVYAIGMTIDPNSLVSGKYATQVFYYEQNSDGFKLLAEGALEKPTEKSSEITFITGERTTTNKNTPNPPSTSLSSPVGEVSPESLVQNYFENIKSGQHQKSWDMLPSDMQNNKSIHPNGYESFTSWWQKASVDVDAVKVVSQSDREAIVKADVRYKVRNGGSKPLSLRYFFNKNSTGNSWMITKIKS